MMATRIANGHAQVEQLEGRTLLSLAPTGSDITVSTDPATQVDSHVVAMDADGDSVVVWDNLFDNDFGPRPWLPARLYDSLGSPKGEPLRGNSPDSGAIKPAVA